MSSIEIRWRRREGFRMRGFENRVFETRKIGGKYGSTSSKNMHFLCYASIRSGVLWVFLREIHEGNTKECGREKYPWPYLHVKKPVHTKSLAQFLDSVWLNMSIFACTLRCFSRCHLHQCSNVNLEVTTFKNGNRFRRQSRISYILTSGQSLSWWP